MSIEAIAWTFKQDIKPASLKLLLIGLANFTDAQWLVWPSIDTLCRITNLNRKTIVSGLGELESRGYISDSGGRKGKTNSVKVYYFNHPDSIIAVDNIAVPKTEQLKQTRKVAEAVPISDGSSTDFGNSPTPPIKKNLLENQYRTIKAKYKKISLVDWEKSVGAELSVHMMASWASGNGVSGEVMKKLVTEFRDVMLANGNQYSDFTAAFKNYLRRGFLSMNLVQAQAASRATSSVEYSDMGMPL